MPEGSTLYIMGDGYPGANGGAGVSSINGEPEKPDEPASDVCEKCGTVHADNFFARTLCFFTQNIQNLQIIRISI